MSAERCDGCRKVQPNVGPWRDGRRLCGSCKVSITFARPGFAAKFASDLGQSIGGTVTIDVRDDDGLPVVPKGSA